MMINIAIDEVVVGYRNHSDLHSIRETITEGLTSQITENLCSGLAWATPSQKHAIAYQAAIEAARNIATGLNSKVEK